MENSPRDTYSRLLVILRIHIAALWEVNIIINCGWIWCVEMDAKMLYKMCHGIEIYIKHIGS